MILKDQNTRDHSAWTGCVSHTAEYLTHGNSKSEARGISRHMSNSKRVVRNMEERNVGTKGKSPKRDLTSAKDLPIELPE